MVRTVWPDGANRIEIEVVNLWVNRLIGDTQPGAVAYAYAAQCLYTAQSPSRPWDLPLWRVRESLIKGSSAMRFAKGSQ